MQKFRNAWITSNPKEEARWIANEISKLMITGNYKYKDIAVDSF